MSSERELIVLAAPATADAYYRERAKEIFDFQVAYAKQVAQHDDVLVLTDAASYEAYASVLGPAHVLVAPMQDIWARDYGLANAGAPVMFRYTAEGQGGGRAGQLESDAVQEGFADLAADAGLAFRASELLNDGGNWVDDFDGRAVLSRKFLRDNDLTEHAAREALTNLTGARHIAFIEADEQGGLEHADGVVAFVEPNVAVINSYPEDPDYAAELKADLIQGLPGVVIHEIVTPYDGTKIVDKRFGSACGLYTNMLVTPSRIYLPQFGIPEDADALMMISRITRKQVIPVHSGEVCQMGGGVRCMSMQLRGEAAAGIRALVTAKPAR